MSEASNADTLSVVLCASVPPGQAQELARLEGLETLLREHYTAGQARWPTVTLSPERFVRHLGRHLARGGGEALRLLHGADLYLACACAGNDRLALQAFEQHILRRVPSRLGALPETTVDEVLQAVRERLLVGKAEAPPRIAEYSGRGPLLSWVRIIGARVAGELASQHGRQELFDAPPETLARMLAPDDPERELLHKDSRKALAEALRQALAALSDRDRALLRLHHLHGLTMDKLSAMYGESRSGVARQVAQARERLLKLTRTALSSTLNLASSEVESLLGLVQSRLDLSLHQWME